jgi:hypothetical protein
MFENRKVFQVSFPFSFGATLLLFYCGTSFDVAATYKYNLKCALLPIVSLMSAWFEIYKTMFINYINIFIIYWSLDLTRGWKAIIVKLLLCLCCWKKSDWLKILKSNKVCFPKICPDVPETRLKLGSSLSGDHIKEGSDVYFDCVIDANPPVSKVDWRHNVSSIKIHLI